MGLPRLVPVFMVTEGSVAQYVSAAYWNVPFPWNNNQSWSSGGMNNAWQGCKGNIRGSIHCRSIVLLFTAGKLSNTSSHMSWNIGEKKKKEEQFDLIYPSHFYPTFNVIAKIGLKKMTSMRVGAHVCVCVRLWLPLKATANVKLHKNMDKTAAPFSFSCEITGKCTFLSFSFSSAERKTL